MATKRSKKPVVQEQPAEPEVHPQCPLRHLKDEDLKCSFCGRHHSVAGWLIAGPGVFICEKCVHVCVDMLKQTAVHRREGSLAGGTSRKTELRSASC